MKIIRLVFSLLIFIFNFQLVQAESPLSGKVIGDGSSTVFPISEAVGEEFQKLNRGIKVAVATSGTGGGFKKLCKGEVDFAGASRPIEAPEIKACEEGKISFIELPVAYDGLTIVINPANTWAETLTTAELKKIWEPESKVQNWSDVRAGFPKDKIILYGPGHDSGTFDYFTKAIVGKEKSSRADFTASEDDNTLVKGVASNKNALGYFGYAYFVSNAKKLKAVTIDNGKTKVLPSIKTIADGEYVPLSRPIFIYVSTKSLERPEVKAFAEFYINQSATLAEEVGYIALPKDLYSKTLSRLNTRVVGTMYQQESDSKKSIGDLLYKTQPKASSR